VFTTGLNTSPTDPLSDGYFFVSRGSDHGPREGVLQTRRQGSVVGSELPVTLAEALTFFRRFVNEYAWYNIAGSRWSETTTAAGDIDEGEIDVLTTEPGDANAGAGGRGPISGTGRAVVQIQRASDSDALDVYAGSSSYKNLGTPTDQLIGRPFEVEGVSHSGGGNWEPAFAIRRTPGYENNLINVRGTTLLEGATDYKLKTIAAWPTNVLDGGGNELTDADFDAPVDLNPNISPIQVTDGSTVAQFPDQNGDTQTAAAQTGGYSLSYDIQRSQGGGQNTVRRGTDFDEPKLILDGDYALTLIKTSSSITDGNVFVTIAAS
jgi:hypothetical protein